MPKYVPVLLIAMIAGFVSYVALAPKGEAAANFTVQTLDAQTFELDAQRGKPVLVSFWATTCSTCIEEIPHLMELQAAYGDKGLQLLGVAMSYDDIDDVKTLVGARELNYTIIHDEAGEIASKLGPVRATPLTLLIDPNGRIVMRNLGYLKLDELKQQIESYLS
ncbi:MAG: TlpA family protein disulfide reductase [Gammaproteobacteria bacterium]|nr:TlpA family protein disulfide reductase [Gammaproteobacteria bacterium]